MKASAWVRLPDAARDGGPTADQAGAAWFDLLVRRLPTGYWDEVLAARLTVPVHRAIDLSPIGSPLAPCAFVTTSGPRRPVRRMVTAKAWPPAWYGLGETFLSRELIVLELDELGGPSRLSRQVRGFAERERDPQDARRPWLRLGAHDEWTRPRGPQRDEWAGWQDEWPLAVLWEFVNDVECDFAMIAPRPTMVFDDGREGAWLPVVQTVLPSYEWVTVASAGVVSRLGGLPALRDGGAFWKVEEVAGGSVWLQATEDLRTFTGPAVDAVVDALAPCLPSRVLRRPELAEYEHPYAAYGRAGHGLDPMPDWIRVTDGSWPAPIGRPDPTARTATRDVDEGLDERRPS